MLEKKLKGFTLIELSIVLVIVALIISGILIGQELIKSANVRAVLTQIDRYNSAVNAFKNKFAAYPGDFNAATTYVSAGATNGDGNGLVFHGTPAAAPTVESATHNEYSGFWNHLSVLSFIDGNFDGTVATVTLGTNYPSLKTNNGGILAYGSYQDSSNYYHLGLASNAGTTLAGSVVFTPDTAYVIDSKMDDGKPGSGTIRAVSAIDVFSTTGDTPLCIQTATAYNALATTTVACQLRVKMY